jgi:hypothetical protein
VESYTQPSDEIKARLETPQAGSLLSQLVTFYAAHGVTSTKLLAERIGVTDRAVRKAKAELGFPRNNRSPGTTVPSNRNNRSAQPEQPFRSEPRVRARIETPSGLVIPKRVSEEPPLPPGERVALVSGEIRICAELRAFWLEQFGGDGTRLDLALIQAAGYVQTASSRPLEAQVGSQLARIAGDKREKDQRYRETAALNRSQQATATEDKHKRAREFLAMARGETVQ